MSIGDPCWTLASLQSLNQLGPARYGSFVVAPGCRWTSWAVRHRPFAQLGTYAFLRETSRTQSVGLCKDGSGIGDGDGNRADWAVMVEIVLEYGHVDELEPQLGCGPKARRLCSLS